MTFHLLRSAAAALLAALLLPLCPASAWAAEDFLDVAQAFRGSVRVLDAQTLEVRFDIAPGYHLYRERLAVELSGGAARVGGLQLPAGVREFDANFNKDVEIYRDALVMRVPVTADASALRLRVEHQGCAEQGLCYPPQSAAVDLQAAGGRLERAVWFADADTAPAGPALVAATAAAPAAAATEAGSVESALRSGSLLTIAGVFLLAGLLLSFTPCVLPMVPILSSIIVGQGAPVSRLRGFSLALAYSLGMALVYTAFGVVAGLLGEGLAAALQNPWVLGAFALLLATLSLSMFGVFELQVPGALQSRIGDVSNRLKGGRHAGVFVMGGLSALIVGPCVAAPLAGALVYISQTRDVVIGGLALFSLACGMSVPLLLVGLSAGSLLPRAGAWMQRVKTFFGVMLLAVALWLVQPVLPVWALMGLVGVGALLGAVFLGLFDRLAPEAGGLARLGKGLGAVLAVLGVTQLVGAASGGTDAWQPLAHLARPGSAGLSVNAQAARPGVEFRRVRSVAELDAVLASAGKPVMLDFYADWCVSCKEMEHYTFSNAEVQQRLGNAVLLQADVTANNAEDKALLKRFGLFGPPGVLFFDARGSETAAARVIGYMPPEKFRGALASAGL
jgi:thioredoxin:protein disulfide reductase